MPSDYNLPGTSGNSQFHSNARSTVIDYHIGSSTSSPRADVFNYFKTGTSTPSASSFNSSDLSTTDPNFISTGPSRPEFRANAFTQGPYLVGDNNPDYVQNYFRRTQESGDIFNASPISSTVYRTSSIQGGLGTTNNMAEAALGGAAIQGVSGMASAAISGAYSAKVADIQASSQELTTRMYTNALAYQADAAGEYSLRRAEYAVDTAKFVANLNSETALKLKRYDLQFPAYQVAADLSVTKWRQNQFRQSGLPSILALGGSVPQAGSSFRHTGGRVFRPTFGLNTASTQSRGTQATNYLGINGRSLDSF
ncbi:TPA_asm: hypothetical protein [Apostichopus japonicus associated picornavirus 1]|nr:TPA_asm: hypothetical protein [Apostichopus japonicus associated picornavirus 1]